MKKKSSICAHVALATICLGLIGFSNEAATDSPFSLIGSWSTGEENQNRSMKLYFADSSFEMDMKLGEKRRTERGKYLKEESEIFLVFVNGKTETQGTMKYEFIDHNTMEITFERNFFLLERKQQ